MSIQLLPQDVVAQIRSSTVITSLNGVVFELVENALDSKSTDVNINVDYSRGGCVVEDDGLGILPSEFGPGGGLGKLYHTSKLNTKGTVHGGRGNFLASVSAMSLVTITSHHHLHRSHNTLTLYKSDVISRQLPAAVQQHLPYFHHGTRVTIRDLFGSMPVRVRQRVITAEKQGGYSKQWGELKRGIVMLLLAWPLKVSVTLRESGTGQRITLRSLPNISLGKTDVVNICNILSQASYITPAEMSSWVVVSASTSKLEIDGTFSLQPSATKSVQFISFGIRPLITEGQSIVHDEINRLFSNSAFGDEEEAPDLDALDKSNTRKETRAKGDKYDSKELKGKRKALDRWPMFYINVHQINTSKMVDVDDILDNYSNVLYEVMELLKAMILEFLTKYYFQSKAKERHPSPKKLDHTIKRQSNGEATVLQTYTICIPSKNEKHTTKDLLGTSIRLPSFRQSDRLDSPFEAWSRVKTGSVLLKHDMGTDPDRSKYNQVSNLGRPSSAPPSSTIESRPLSIGASTPVLATKRKATPLLSYTGELIRRPFDDIPINEALSEHCSQGRTYNEESRSYSDNLVPWMNPATKITSLVDERTGLVTPRRLSGSKDNTRLSARINPESQAPQSEPSPWLASVLDGWDNPVFQPTETEIRKISHGGQDLGTRVQNILQGHSCHDAQFEIENVFKESLVGTSGRISKDALRDAKVISQVDKKFILVKLYLPTSEEGNDRDGRGGVLVVIDQHGADERVRIENLMAKLCMPPQPYPPSESGVQTTPLDKPLCYIVSPKETSLLKDYRSHFADWGVIYDLSDMPVNLGDEKHIGVIIKSLPPGIAERCKANPKVLIELIRAEIWRIYDQGANPSTRDTSTATGNHSWVAKSHSCPRGIIDMLNSRACRSAIMFNDELSNEQCEVLISRLGKCAFPFQCAHGRPILAPLVDLGTLWTFTNTKKGE